MHTEFAPHGSPPPTRAFLERALELGFERITLAEHAPLPAGVPDPTPPQDNNIAAERLEPYLRHAAELRERYRGRIDVRVGLEVDLLPGHDDHLRSLVDRHGTVLDEVVCSVHLLPDGAGGWGSLDFSPETFAGLARRHGSVAALRRLYFQTLAEQLERDACAPLPRRVGHLLLVDKFRALHPGKAHDEDALVARVVDVAAAKDYGLDLNSAGLRQPHCGALYLRGAPLAQALRLRMPIVFGSDAHRPDEVGCGWAEAGTEIGRAG